jgi:hypothetical protein
MKSHWLTNATISHGFPIKALRPARAGAVDRPFVWNARRRTTATMNCSLAKPLEIGKLIAKNMKDICQFFVTTCGDCSSMLSRNTSIRFVNTVLKIASNRGICGASRNKLF